MTLAAAPVLVDVNDGPAAVDCLHVLAVHVVGQPIPALELEQDGAAPCEHHVGEPRAVEPNHNRSARDVVQLVG